MSKALSCTFILYLVVAIIFGLPLVLFPGAFLAFFEWAPVDPLLSRVLGAALLADAWSCFRVLRGADPSAITIVLEMQLFFAVLSGIGFLRHLLIANYPLMVWLVLALFTIFAIAWTALLVAQAKQRTTLAAR
jgi:hypothetical protein